MNTYCEGTDCDKKSHCALHCVGPGEYEYIDWSTYGSGSFTKDNNGNYQSVIEHSCGNLGNFKHYVPLKELTREENYLKILTIFFVDIIMKLFRQQNLS